MCHVILLLLFFGLPVFWLRPLSMALPVYLLILLLSAWVYYYTIAAMCRDVTEGAGLHGIDTRRIPRSSS